MKALYESFLELNIEKINFEIEYQNESYQQVFVQLVWTHYEHDFDDNHIDFLVKEKNILYII
jgi:hypothetical protein